MRARGREYISLPLLRIARILGDEVGMWSIRELDRVKREVEKRSKSLSDRLAYTRDREGDTPTREEEVYTISDRDRETSSEVMIDRYFSLSYPRFSGDDRILEWRCRDIELSGEFTTYLLCGEVCLEGFTIYLLYTRPEYIVHNRTRAYDIFSRIPTETRHG